MSTASPPASHNLQTIGKTGRYLYSQFPSSSALERMASSNRFRCLNRLPLIPQIMYVSFQPHSNGPLQPTYKQYTLSEREDCCHLSGLAGKDSIVCNRKTLQTCLEVKVWTFPRVDHAISILLIPRKCVEHSPNTRPQRLSLKEGELSRKKQLPSSVFPHATIRKCRDLLGLRSVIL